MYIYSINRKDGSVEKMIRLKSSCLKMRTTMATETWRIPNNE